MTIFVVDDEPFIARVTVEALHTLGFADARAYHDARDALADLELAPEAVDTVLLDLQMPELDGIEFIRHLGRLRYAGRLLIISGEDARLLRTAQHLAVEHGLRVLGSVRKPVALDALRTLLGAAAADAHQAAGIRYRYAPHRLRDAIARGELATWYQPKVSLADGALLGVEALVRWRHPDDGLILPEQFVGVAEASGLIDDLTRAVLRDALRDARPWSHGPQPLQVAVNISMDSLSSLDFPDTVAQALADAGTAPESLVLEVNESRLLQSGRTAFDLLGRLRLKHVGLSIDDVGTGYASSAQLQDLPLDELKVDGSVVHGSSHDAPKRAIFEASVRMARHLRLRAIAEGVEDRADWDVARAIGCDAAQGYFIAEPMPAQGLAAWATQWEARRPELGFG